MAVPTPLQIAVVGAGTAGPAAALFLSRAGAQVTLFEQTQAPSPVGAGITLQPTGLSVLSKLGLLDEIIAAGSSIERLYGRTRGGRTVLDLSYKRLHPEYFGLGVHRGTLFSALFEQVKREPITMCTGASVVALREDNRRAYLRTEAGEQSFDLVVVADGARSRLRSQLPLKQSVRPYRWGALWTVVPMESDWLSDAGFAHSALGSTLTQVFDGTRRFVGFLPTGIDPKSAQPVLSVFWSIEVSQMDGFLKAGIGHFKDQIRDLIPTVEPLLDQLNEGTAVLPAHYFDVVMPRAFTERIVCIGDAAHAMSPQLGQGANLALYDAWSLACCIAGARESIPQALVHYDKLRRAHLRFYQYATRWLTPFFQSSYPLLGGLRDLTMGPLCRLPFFSTQGLGAMAGYKTGVFGAVENPKALLP